MNFQFDSRLCNEKSIFIALETGQRSGTEFAQDAIKNGAKVVVSQKLIQNLQPFEGDVDLHKIESFDKNTNVIVQDSLSFIQKLAKQKFNELKKSGVKTIGITGSIGKTTTKELISSTLNLYGKAYSTQGNYNNHIGLPITILNSPYDINFLVLEMGMNHEGEIKLLTSIAPCDWNIITNVRESHIGNFHDGIEGVRKAKFEMLHSGGKCFVLKNEYTQFLANHELAKSQYKCNIVRFDAQTEVFYKNEKTFFNFEDIKFELNGIYSKGQVEMFSLAIALINDILGKKITQISLPILKGRGNIVSWHGIKIINDSYNASASSIKNALENFRKLNGKKLCILGDIRELGTNAEMYHQEIKPHLTGFDGILLVGTEFAKVSVPGAKYFDSYSTCLEFCKSKKSYIQSFDAILVKASNGTGLWKFFEDFFI